MFQKGVWLHCDSHGWDQEFKIQQEFGVSDSHNHRIERQWRTPLSHQNTRWNTSTTTITWNRSLWMPVHWSTTDVSHLDFLFSITGQLMWRLTVFLFSDSIVLIFWIILAAFIGFFFLILSFISHSGQLPRWEWKKKFHCINTMVISEACSFFLF